MTATRSTEEAYFTIGHSTRSVQELACLLQEAGADFVVDVRSIPRSRSNPQFNADSLPAALTRYGLSYCHIARLGGLRHRAKAAGASPNMFWENASFRNYADYAAGEEFRAGLAELRAIAADHCPAIMCAEAVWWRCHRRIIADYLLAAGADVRHIMGHGKIGLARMTETALRQADGSLIYPAM